MHCLTVIYPRPDDEAHFRNYYSSTHLPLAAKLPGLVRMQVAYPEMIGPGDVFCIFQGFFADGAAKGAAMESEIGQQVAGDAPNYSPKGAQVMHFAVEA